VIDFDQALIAANAAFGENVLYWSAFAGNPAAMTGIFNDRYQETKLQDGVEITNVGIALGIRAAQFAVPPRQREVFQIRGIYYVIIDPPESDGLGDLKIRLRAADDYESARMREPTENIASR
jgi:hypothetical protein